MNELELEFESILAGLEDSDKYHKLTNTLAVQYKGLKKTGVSQGLMLALESSREEGDTPLTSPIALFTSDYSMTGLELAQEAFKARIYDTAKKAISLGIKALQKLWDFIYKLLNKFKLEKNRADRSIEPTTENVVEMLDIFVKGTKLNEWMIKPNEGLYGSQKSIEFIKFMDTLGNDYLEKAKMINDCIGDLVSIESVNDILDANQSLVNTEDKFKLLNDLIENLKDMYADTKNGEVLNSIIKDDTLTDIKDSRVLGLYNRVYSVKTYIDNAAVARNDDAQFSKEIYSYASIVEGHSKIEELKTDLKATYREVKDSREETYQGDLAKAVVAIKTRGSELDDSQEYLDKLMASIKEKNNVEVTIARMLMMAASVANSLHATSYRAKEIVDHYSPEANKR